ncbi:hypothetical protein tb265_49090 [Gemmatimonadetes bacterium T265]|nr:hypothetical protein tb265_49090 [Gemmatimonadetes bacterium T265]
MGTSALDCGQADAALLARLATPSRNRYYYGKLLDSYHLELEQRYGGDKRRLINRLTLGTGVLCGLDVAANADGTRVRVRAGVAVDGVGREIVVPQDSPPVDPRQPTDDCGRPDGAPARGGEAVTLFLCYHECEAEPAPVLVSECGPERTCENGLVRERYRLRVGRGEAPPPGSLTPEQCAAIFGQPPGNEPRRTLLCRLLDGGCDPPEETCVPLATIRFDPNGGLAIDRCAPRRTIYSNATLLDLILCLAARVDACCGGDVQVRAIEAVSGGGQSGPAGQPLPQPLVARVTDGGAPAANVAVTFAATTGGGQVGATPATLGPSFVATTDAGGLATLPLWALGPAPGAQQVTASITSGAPASVTFDATATQVQVDLPVVLTVWPPNAVTLSFNAPDPKVRDWARLLLDTRRIELTFNHKMNVGDLKEMQSWLRVFTVMLRSDREAVVRRVDLAYGGPVSPGVLGTPGFAESYRLVEIADGELKSARWIVMIRAEGGNIVDTGTPALLLDAEFGGSALTGAEQDAVWNVTAAQPLPRAVWDALVDSGAALPQSGDGAEGGRFDSWFAVDGVG